jgi:hypothetical protein
MRTLQGFPPPVDAPGACAGIAIGARASPSACKVAVWVSAVAESGACSAIVGVVALSCAS